MNSNIKNIVKSMKGVFIPKKPGEDKLIKGISSSLKELEFYGLDCDKKNIRGDIFSISRDFNKAKKETKEKFNIEL